MLGLYSSRLYRRHALAPLGIGLVAVALADRIAFFSVTGAVLMLAGVLVLALTMIAPNPPSTENIGYPVLLVGLALMTALTTEVPSPRDPVVALLTVGGAVAFYVCTLVPRLHRYRLHVAASLLIAAHAVIILKVPVPPNQDVWRFLNYGADALLKGQNPYGDYIGADGASIRLTYPPTAILLLAPFRILAGDIRWGYIACEAAVIALLPRLLRRQSGLPTRWQEALILIPLVLPRVSQAFFVFSNHEWLLLALALGALVLALESRWMWAGLLVGLGLAGKQYFVIFPLLFLLPALRLRAIATGAAVAAAITLPFLAWDDRAFVDHLLGNLRYVTYPGRLTIWAMLAHAGFTLERTAAEALSAAGGLAALALAWAGRRSLSTQLMACGLGLFAFTLGATFAGYNYYVYGLVFFTWGLLIPASAGRLVKSE